MSLLKTIYLHGQMLQPYSIPLWSEVIFDKLVVTPLVRKFTKFITTFTGAHYQSLIWGRWIKSTNSEVIYLDLIHTSHIIPRFSKTQEIPASYSQLITAYMYYCIILHTVDMVNVVRVWERTFTSCSSQNKGYTLLAFGSPSCLHSKFLWNIYYLMPITLSCNCCMGTIEG